MLGQAITWTDVELIAELKRLEDADCLTMDVWTGNTPDKKRDASHHLPRLLALAERGLKHG